MTAKAREKSCGTRQVAVIAHPHPLAPRDQRRRALLLAGLAAAVTPAGGAFAQFPTDMSAYYNHLYLMNRWKQDQYIHIESGPVRASQISFSWWSAQWTIEPWYLNQDHIRADIAPAVHNHVVGWYRIRNRWKRDHFLHVERGRLEAGTIQTGWESALWAFDNMGDNFFRIRNRQRTDHYIHINDSGSLVAGPIQSGWWSAQWRAYRLPQG